MIRAAEKTYEQLKEEEHERQVLEKAAQRLETLVGNQAYRQAFAKAAYEIRRMKP